MPHHARKVFVFSFICLLLVIVLPITKFFAAESLSWTGIIVAWASIFAAWCVHLCYQLNRSEHDEKMHASGYPDEEEAAEATSGGS